MRTTRALLRRRIPRRRTRAALVTHVQQTNRQDNLPALGTKSASKTHRPGGAERLADPAVHNSRARARARIDSSDQLLRDVAWGIVKTATPHAATTRSLLQTVPGMGTLLTLVLVDERQASARFPRGQAVVSYGRVVKGAKASAGKRSGTSGTKSGNAELKWALSEAAVVFLRHHPAGPKALGRFETKPGTGKAVPVLAHQLARAVSSRFKRGTACTMDQFLPGEGSGAGEPAASRGHAESSLTTVLGEDAPPAAAHAHEHRGAWP